MSENLQKRPAKGILKNSSSFDKQECQPSAKKAKETKWDEMNIIATYHPPGKDYGHMKIDEPKTPYNYDVDMDNVDGLNAEELAEKIRIAADKPPKVFEPESDSSDEEEELTEEEKQRRKDFELKRKKHYNEFHALQMARKLLEEEEDDDEEETSTVHTSSTQN
ncbi:protein phosphatase inhibitor 2-like [Sitophilus oryzae]|uniref:Protein phosphatase inhibitor 2-like n=1 Tax=Sitophilus oryzae TaxID=7048 RepID=A0A6J2XSS6_SITOR|nr:protein phosphatase inhibitor 2-like [Sitophilus oryzae]XP_030754563.1 protein phosphatase inhibitor 2-like [Sitophilus oryzae]